MQNVLDQLSLIRSDSIRWRDELANKYNFGLEEEPFSAFSKCHNLATLALELGTYYKNEWQSDIKPLKISRQQAQEENASRVIEFTKANFIFSISAIEYAMRETDKKNQKVISLDRSKILFLRNFVRSSEAVGILDKDSCDMWNAIIDLRNAVVHNNGVANCDASVKLSNGLHINMEAGKMIQGTLMHFPQATHWVLGSFSEWCDAFLGKIRRH